MTRQRAKEITLKIVKPFQEYSPDPLTAAAQAMSIDYARRMEEYLAGVLREILRQVPEGSTVMRVHDCIMIEMPRCDNEVVINALITQYGAIVQPPQSVPLLTPA
jgi:hypothetical protein